MVSNFKSTIIIVLFLLILFGAMAYLDSFQLKNNEISTFQANMPNDEMDETVANDAFEDPSLMPTLENKLVDTTEEDGYLVETYREYEVYKDQSGNVIKSVPTSNYDFLRYKN